MAKRLLVKIKKIGPGRYSGQFDCRRGDVVLLPRGEAERLLEDEPGVWKKMPVNAKVSVYAREIKDPREGEAAEYETVELPEPEDDDEDDEE